jgi:hypothetical protein
MPREKIFALLPEFILLMMFGLLTLILMPFLCLYEDAGMGIPGESISLALALVLDFGISLGESFLEFSLLLVLLIIYEDAYN